MSTNNSQPDASAPAHPDVLSDLRDESEHNPCVRRLLEYLRGDRTKAGLDMSQDVVPALNDMDGTIVMRFSHTGKTEYVWPADESDTVSSCYYDDGRAHMEDVPIGRDELADFRDLPKATAFLPACNVEHLRPGRALEGDDA